jgi:adenine phosphoribosyltransferase
MSIATEAALANEAGIPYSAIAMSTDYDCWKEDEEPVTWEKVLETFIKNVTNVTNLIIDMVNKIKESPTQIKLKEKIRTIPDWPKPGIMFRDITTLLKDKEGFKLLINTLCDRYKDYEIDSIAGTESRGFIIGSALAYKLGVGFIPIRKKGKLPAETVGQEYELEYGTDKVEIHKDAINPGDKILLVDDLIATGGTAIASAELIKKLKGDIIECTFVINLPEIGGKQKLQQAGYKTFSLVEFDGE